jgi:chromosome segregation ATPase
MNIQISWWGSDVKSLNRSVNESRTKIEINAYNIGAINGSIRGSKTRIKFFDGRVRVLEEMPDFTSERSSINNSITNLQSQIDRLRLPDCITEIRSINNQQSTINNQLSTMNESIS